MFEQYNSTSNSSDLVDAIATDTSGIEIDFESINFIGADGQASFYDGSITELGIGSGILLTSGDGNPPGENTSGSFGLSQNGVTSDPQLQAVADSAFEDSGEVQDINSLGFNFTVTDPNVESVSFNLVFGSDEFPEFSDSSFVDVAAVFVNGENVGLFNNDPNQPLSIISENLELGNYQDNANNIIPLEYDGISSVLSIVAPVVQGENTIRFAIADTGDTIYDSGLFISNFASSGVDTGDDGSGVLLNAPGTEEADEITGDDTDQFIEGLGGNDTINPGGGNDIVDAGAGDDLIFSGIGNNGIDGGEGNDTVSYAANQEDLSTTLADGSITVVGNNDGGEFTDTLTNVETIQYGDESINTDTLQPENGNDNEVDVYRFFRTDTQTQFYTTTDIERESVLANLPQYDLEGVSFVGVAAPEEGQDPLTGTSPVYRFFNTSTGIHLYTADENERAFVEENLDNYVAEGTPYYGYDTQVEGTVPLYRFYNSSLDAHFYTPSAEERDLFLESPDYAPEGGGDGIAFYVEPAPEI